MRLDEKTGLKRCSRCGEEKSDSEFFMDKIRVDGLAPQCISCFEKYRHENKSKFFGYKTKRLAKKERERNALYDELIQDEEFRSLLINLGK